MDVFIEIFKYQNGVLFRKHLKPSTIFTRGPSWMYDWVLSTPLKGFVQDVPREELAIATVVECLATTGWQNYL